MARTIFIRHSIPEIVPARPARDWRLSPAGVAAARALAVRLGPIAPGAVVSSDEPKAHETARIIAAHLGRPVALSPGFREHGRLTVPFLPRDEFEAAIADLFARPDQRVFGDETANAVFDRFDAAIRDARLAHPTDDLVCVTHGTALTIYLERHAGIDPLPFWRALTMPMALALEGQELTVL